MSFLCLGVCGRILGISVFGLGLFLVDKDIEIHNITIVNENKMF